MTSNPRTARCGPARRVVWQGRRRSWMPPMPIQSAQFAECPRSKRATNVRPFFNATVTPFPPPSCQSQASSASAGAGSTFTPRLRVSFSTCISAMPVFSLAVQHHRAVHMAHRLAGGVLQHPQRAAELQQQPEHQHGDAQHHARPAPADVAGGNAEDRQGPADESAFISSTPARPRWPPRCARPRGSVSPSIGFFGALALGTTATEKPELGGLLQPLLPARRGPHLAGQADLAEGDEAARQRPCRAGCPGWPAAPPGRPPAR